MKKDKLTAEDYLNQRNWKKFLLAIPLDKPKGYLFQDANDLNIIKVRASQLNADPTLDRIFSVKPDFNTKVATITATSR